MTDTKSDKDHNNSEVIAKLNSANDKLEVIRDEIRQMRQELKNKNYTCTCDNSIAEFKTFRSLMGLTGIIAILTLLAKLSD